MSKRKGGSALADLTPEECKTKFREAVDVRKEVDEIHFPLASGATAGTSTRRRRNSVSHWIASKSSVKNALGVFFSSTRCALSGAVIAILSNSPFG